MVGVAFLIKLKVLPLNITYFLLTFTVITLYYFTTLLTKNFRYSCYPVNFVQFLRTPFFTEHPPWLLLKTAQNYPTNDEN